MPDNLISMTIPPHAFWLTFVQDGLNRYGRMVGFPEKLEKMLAHSVMEALEELYGKAEKSGVSDRVGLSLNFKGEAVIVEIDYNANIPLNPHQTEEYEIPDAETELSDVNLDSLWLHMIKLEMDRIHFMVRGSRHVLRMVKYSREEGREKQAWVMSVKPELRKRLILHLDDTAAEYPSSVLQNPDGGVLKLGPSETFIIRQMDGQTSFHDIYMAHIDALGLTSPDVLAKLYERIEKMDMLADPEADIKKTRFRQVVKTIVNPNFSIPRADDFVTAVHDKTKFIYTYFGLALFLAVGLSGLAPLIEHGDRFRTVIVGLEEIFFKQPWMILPLYFLTLFHVMLHELGHGVTCKHYGGLVPRLGVMFYLASFIFYCDTTAAWNFPEKRQRLFVSLGGPIVSFAILGIGLWAAGWYAGSNSLWESVFVIFSLLNFFGLVMNFNPLIKMDAYYMLVDVTGIPNLREKSFKFLKRKALGWLGLGRVEDVLYPSRERRIFWMYGLLGGAMTMFFLAVPILRLNRALGSESVYGGELFWVLLIITLLIVRLSHMAFSMLKSVWHRDYKIQ